MKHLEIDHVVVDETNKRPYVVRANRALTDDEAHRHIWLEILRRGRALAHSESVSVQSAQKRPC